MKSRRLFFRLAPLVTALFLFVVGYPTSVATAAITYGTLDNFDVINDTGGETHGFEIELEGISAPDVVYTFGAPYQRYGDPTLVPTATGVIIRYAASYTSSTWSATTPIGVAPYLPTQGHSCWIYGVADPQTYYASGCDHFGASLNATPAKTTYRWLVASTTTPGTLTPFGSNVPIPAPVWNVTPPVDPAVNQPVAAAIIAPPASADPTKCGDALWAKVYVTELPGGLQADDLDFMVIDHPDANIVPNEPAEIEWEWVLLQACPGNAGEQEFGGGAEVGAGNEAVSRRFEYYKYTGQYDSDPEAIKEALCDNPTALDQQLPLSPRCGVPDSNGVAGVGDLIGAQNVAINLAGPVVIPNHAPVANAGGNQSVRIRDTVTLNGSGSDVDGNPLTYSWSLTAMPAHSKAVLSGATSASPTFKVDKVGTYAAALVVNDGTVNSAPATVTITATRGKK